MKYSSTILLVLIGNVAFAQGTILERYQELQQEQQQQNQSSQEGGNTIIYESGTNAAIIHPQGQVNNPHRAGIMHKGANEAVQNRENIDRRRR